MGIWQRVKELEIKEFIRELESTKHKQFVGRFENKVLYLAKTKYGFKKDQHLNSFNLIVKEFDWPEYPKYITLCDSRKEKILKFLK